MFAVKNDYKHIIKNPQLYMRYINTYNRQLSEHVYMDYTVRAEHKRNANVLIVGGSGAGKTQFWVRPNLMNCNGSYIITDPKGEILRTMGGFLEMMGYKILVLNLTEHGIFKSNRYNPFKYIKNYMDLQKFVNAFVKNTTPKDAQKGEPFWENAEKLLLEALFAYAWLVAPEGQKNFRTVMELLKKAEFSEDPRTGEKLDSELDIIFSKLEEENVSKNIEETGQEICTHPAVIAYNKVMRGAADTVRSIIISVNSRLQRLASEEILDLLSEDEFNIEEIGAGVGYDGKTKTAVFCVIPDSDTTYNFIVGQFYTQVFQHLYAYADFGTDNGELPINVTFMLDEFANVPLPDDYLSLLSTMRSRGISSVIIIQNLAQIKKLYPHDEWESIPGNCDTLIYLGGNEKSTHKYMSESLGKGTYYKDSSSKSYSQQNSSSVSTDKFGRELMTEDEIRRIPRDKCLIMVSGLAPVYDDKINTFAKPFWKYVKGARYNYDARIRRNKRNSISQPIMGMVTQLEYQNKLKAQERAEERMNSEEEIMKNKKVFEFTADEFINLNFDATVSVESILSDGMADKNKKINENIFSEEFESPRDEEQDFNEYLKCNEKYIDDILELLNAGYAREQIMVLSPLLTDAGYKSVDIQRKISKELKMEELQSIVDILSIK